MPVRCISLVPEDPRFIPDLEKQSRARRRLIEIAFDAEAVNVVVSELVQFFDCGANFERVLCPSCESEIPIAWRHDRMDEDHDEGFQLKRYLTPCCQVALTLREFIYDWPQTFGQFAFEVMSPNPGSLKDEHRRELEEILGTKLLVIDRLV